PTLTAVTADLDMGMALGRISGWNRFIVYVGKIGGVITIDGDGRIGALGLRDAAGNSKLSPGNARICADRAALLGAAVRDRQPGCTIWRNVHMPMQTPASGSIAVVDHYAGTIADAEAIAALTFGGAHWVCLAAVVDSLTLV